MQVKRKLLRPCISLTKAVRSEEEGSPEVTVDVDTLTFDRQAVAALARWCTRMRKEAGHCSSTPQHAGPRDTIALFVPATGCRLLRHSVLHSVLLYCRVLIFLEALALGR